MAARQFATSVPVKLISCIPYLVDAKDHRIDIGGEIRTEFIGQGYYRAAAIVGVSGFLQNFQALQLTDATDCRAFGDIQRKVDVGDGSVVVAEIAFSNKTNDFP